MALANLRRYRPAVAPARLILPLLAFLAVCLIALALVWPQGTGRRSPAPFGHPLAPTHAGAH